MDFKIKKYLFIILILILGLYITNNKYDIKEDFLTYTKCSKYKNNRVLQNFFDSTNITRVERNDNWDLYVPCEYTNIESELQKLNPNNKNQYIFGIEGCDKMVAKDLLWYYFKQKFGINYASNYLPETYILDNKKDMTIFKKNFNSKNIYLLKKNIQRKLGIKITKDLKEILNARNDGFVIVQKYLDDLYLINKRKINLRIYLLVTCKDGNSRWYISTLGKCIYTNKDYDSTNIKDPEIHLTSLNLKNDIYNTNPINLNELEEYIGTYTYQKLFTLILLNGKQCKNCFKNLVCTEKRFNDNISFQLFGLDYVFTKNMKPYLLEMNKGPAMKYVNEKDRKLKEKVHADIFDIIGLVKYKNIKNDFIEI